jgi:hypothetical protein
MERSTIIIEYGGHSTDLYAKAWPYSPRTDITLYDNYFELGNGGSWEEARYTHVLYFLHEIMHIVGVFNDYYLDDPADPTSYQKPAFWTIPFGNKGTDKGRDTIGTRTLLWNADTYAGFLYLDYIRKAGEVGE